MERNKILGGLLLVIAALILFYPFVKPQVSDFVSEMFKEPSEPPKPPKPLIIDDFEVSEGNGKNIILITLDTLRSDHVHYLGYKRNTTPFLDKFAQESIVFESAYAPIPLTTPSHTSMLTGLYPVGTGVKSNMRRTSKPSLAEMLNRTGYLTAAFVSAQPTLVLASRFNVSNKFEPIEINESEDFTPEQANKTGFRQAGNITLAQFTEWIENTEINQPVFIWVHFYDAHSPYESEYKDEFGAVVTYPEAAKVLKRTRPGNETIPYFQDQIVKLYDGGVYTVDKYAERVIKLLEEKDLLDNSLTIIAGDHGENLGERRDYFHGKDVYDATTRVPLMLKIPGAEHLTLDQDVSLVSITPTILDYLQMDFSETLSSPSLFQVIDGIETPSFLMSGFAGHPPFNRSIDEQRNVVIKPDRTVQCEDNESQCASKEIQGGRAAVVFDHKKLVYNGGATYDYFYYLVTGNKNAINISGGKTVEFYDLEKDPIEAKNLFGLVNTSKHEELLDTWMKLVITKKTSSEPLDKESIEALKSLGYMG